MLSIAPECWNPTANFWQWFNIFVGTAGLVAGLFSSYESWKAARNAIDAENAANEARDAVLDMVRYERLADLSRELEDLHHLIHHPVLLIKKCNRMRGIVVNFKHEAAKQLDGDTLQKLDSVREQLTAIIEPAFNPKGLTKENRLSRLTTAFGIMGEAVESVRAIIGIGMTENRQ